MCSGVDLHSGGFARTHAQMAVVLAEHLADTDQTRRCTGIGNGSATGPTTPGTAVDAMSDDLSATVTDDRVPGWRARLIHDDCAGEPDGDALAPALLVPSRGRPRLAKGVYLPVHAEQIVAA